MAGLSKFSTKFTSKNGAFCAIAISISWLIIRKLNTKKNKKLVCNRD